MKVQRLNSEARSKLLSGVIVTDAVQCVLELVYNSLDADASGVAVRIDLKKYMIRVIDNGKGIGKEDLKLVGERFMTSKHYSSDFKGSVSTYGFKGQALSSLLDVSKILTIETKSGDDNNTYIKVFQKSNALPVTKASYNRSGTGTTVTIEDFMYTMPVRRKRIAEIFDLEEIKTQLQYLAVIHYDVCFTLKNDSSDTIILQTLKASNILESISNIYGKSFAKSLSAVNHQEKNYKIKGFLTLKSQSQNNIQLLYINQNIVTKGVIHKFINNLLKEYKGKEAVSIDESPESPTGLIFKTSKSFQSYSYIIQIKCPKKYYELFTNLRKTTVEFKNWKDVLKCIHRGIRKTFKKIFNLESSISIRDDVEIRKSSKNKKAFGTSVLINAVKGPAAKRRAMDEEKKLIKKIKKIELNENNSKIKFDYLPEEESKSSKAKSVIDSLSTTTKYNEKNFTSDTLESPALKNHIGGLITSNLTVSKKNCDSFNKSYFKFYEWFKANFEKDNNAFNLYSDYIQFKNKSGNTNELKSPILGRQFKKKRACLLKKQNPEGNKEITCVGRKKNIAIPTLKRLKNIPSSHLKAKKFVPFKVASEVKAEEDLNLNCITNETFNLKNFNKEIISKTHKDMPVSNSNKMEIDCNISPASESSQAHLTNVIKFRNMCESSYFQSSIKKLHSTFFATNTWSSHYKDFLPENFQIENKINKEKWITALAQYEADFGDKNVHSGNLQTYAPEVQVDLNNKNNIEKQPFFEDVEIQVNMSELVVHEKKVSAIVQTSFENSFLSNQSPKKSTYKTSENNLEGSCISEEVTCPDICDNSPQLQYTEGDKNINKSLPKDLHKKNYNCKKFFNIHKSISLVEGASTAKEIQTLDAVSPKSLTKIDYEINDIKSNKSVESEDALLSKTILIEELNSDKIKKKCALSTGSGFYLSGRHNFVPKGLSPDIINPNSDFTCGLSSQEKNKIKETVINNQNANMLSKVKWESATGECLKPTIPDEIIFELRRKAGEKAINLSAPVLSASLSYCAVKVQYLLQSFAFTKDLLSNIEILGQLDKKFIVAKMKISAPKKMELISVFDQHAVDERIKLEELINANITLEGKFISTSLNSPVICTFTNFHIRAISILEDKLSKFGLAVKVISENKALVNEIPTFLLQKNQKDYKNKKNTPLSVTIETLIVNIITETIEAGGAVTNIPKFLHDAFCLEACHKAVKFNKELSTDLMIEMIDKLQFCKLPFQCAHGRPSVIPIIDLKDLKFSIDENEIQNLEKFKKFIFEKDENNN